jgi:hypothetical protein
MKYPTIQDYLDWAERQGFTIAMAPVECGAQLLTQITITAPSGAHVIELVEDLSDLLMSTSVARLDRSLGRKSFLFE